MSSSAPKTKLDKQKGKSAVKEIPPSEPPKHDEEEPKQETEELLICGVSCSKWNTMLIQEEGDEIVGGVMDELMCKVMDACYKSDVKEQLIPYTVSWAKSYLTKTVKSQILCLDEGEGPEELCGTEDHEPMPSVPDCCAQGCVPTVRAGCQHPWTSHQI
ncbi:hypothetical protein CHARACLAT_023073 [Characodon lateralis]|uniref:Uncharacterized protein n=1 Tax=Characodon lateralis TaxID=208331 RepID=A0ABU7EYK3_9TELE|nr:hypothetical protein [Characodon lateralis]